MTQRSLQTRLTEIQFRIRAAAEKAGRKAEEITLLAVTKVVALPVIEEALRAGQYVFGENYVQEAKPKILSLRTAMDHASGRSGEHRGKTLRFDCIGHLQSNKVRTAVELFDVIQTVDSERLAMLIDEEARRIGKRQRVLIEVNVSHADSKSGVRLDEVEKLLDRTAALTNVDVEGLMSIGTPPELEDGSTNRNEFRQMYELIHHLRKRNSLELPTLSMGMSIDFPAAIEEGATLVRIGSALFGERE